MMYHIDYYHRSDHKHVESLTSKGMRRRVSYTIRLPKGTKGVK